MDRRPLPLFVTKDTGYPGDRRTVMSDHGNLGNPDGGVGAKEARGHRAQTRRLSTGSWEPGLPRRS